MCELLGMSANTPTDIMFSFTGLMRRGGVTGPHKDGWGIAFYEGRGVRMFHDPAPGAESEIAQLLQRYPIKSELVISHIRHANVGGVSLVNTHPFSRELWGRHWVFAHNGQLSDFHPSAGFYQPVGDTDSEAAFCDLLNRLRNAHPDGAPLDALLPLMVEACDEYRRHGVFNCLLGNGNWLFSYCSTKLASITRRAPFGAAELKDVELVVNFQQQAGAHDVVTVIATEALTRNEQWTLFQPGEWRVWRKGECIAQADMPSAQVSPV